MFNYKVTTYDRDGTVRERRTTARVSSGSVALDALTGQNEQARASKIVIERILESIMLLPEERKTVASLLRQYRDVALTPKREALDHWIKRLEDE